MSRVTIRHGRQEDLDALVALGLAFIAGSPYRSRVKPSPERMRQTLSWLLSNGAIFVAEKDEHSMVGMFGVIAMPDICSGSIVGSDLFWWVSPDSRGTTGLKLLRAAVAWAREQGAERFVLVAPDERAERLYERLGYKKTETAYECTLER